MLLPVIQGSNGSISRFSRKGGTLYQFAYCIVQSVSILRIFFFPQFKLKLPLANLLQVGQVRAQHLKRPFWACKQSWILAPRHFLANFLRQACQEPQKFWLIDFAHIFRQIEVFVCIVLLICIRMPIHRRELHNCIKQRKTNEKWCCLFSSKKNTHLRPIKTSGLLYHRVTTTDVSKVQKSYILANPKSVSLMVPSIVTSRFCGLRSLK